MEKNIVLFEILDCIKNKNHTDINNLINKDIKYNYGLKDCVILGYIEGLVYNKNVNNEYVFQKLDNFKITEKGYSFLKEQP